MVPAKSRQKAIDRFWIDVEDLLTNRYGRPQRDAQRGISTYKNEINKRKLGGVVFNQGAEQVARVIDGIIEHGPPATDLA